MFQADNTLENALTFSRFDREHPLSTADRGIELEGRSWPSAEHYVAVMLAGNRGLAERVNDAQTAQGAYQLIKPWYRPKVRGWKSLRRVYMTRALYTVVQMYPDVAKYLVETEDQLIAESSAYDHYWGIGRDMRGENMLGKVWMDIRKKLQEKDKE